MEYTDKAFAAITGEVRIFTFHLSETAQFSVRVVSDEMGNPWFVASDVCAALGIGRTDDGVSRLDPDEKGAVSIRTLGGAQQMTVVNEAGLYDMILTSRKPAAKPFRRWVTSEVLPTLRRTGRYEMPGAVPPTLPQTFAQALRLAADQQDVIERQHAELERARPKVVALETITGHSRSRSLRDAARVLKIAEGHLIDKLLEHGWLLRNPDYIDGRGNVCRGRLTAAAKARQRGVVEIDVVDANGKARDCVRITPCGVERLAELLPRWTTGGAS